MVSLWNLCWCDCTVRHCSTVPGVHMLYGLAAVRHLAHNISLLFVLAKFSVFCYLTIKHIQNWLWKSYNTIDTVIRLITNSVNLQNFAWKLSFKLQVTTDADFNSPVGYLEESSKSATAENVLGACTRPMLYFIDWPAVSLYHIWFIIYSSMYYLWSNIKPVLLSY